MGQVNGLQVLLALYNMAKFFDEVDEFDNNFIPSEECIITNSTYIEGSRTQEGHIKDLIKSRVTSFFQEQNQNEELAINSAIHELFSISESVSKSPNLINIISKIFIFLKTFPFNEMNDKKLKLKGHVGLFLDSHPWIDLEAAKILEFDSALFWSPPNAYKPPKLPPLSPQLRDPLENGQYIPLQHLLHGLSLAAFYPKFETNYPYPFTLQLPQDFLTKIKKCDVIRGATVHSLFLGIKFPLFASTLPGLIEDLWHFMYKEKYSALAGIELYNEVFYEFSRNLGLCIVRSVDQVSPEILKKVKNNY